MVQKKKLEYYAANAFEFSGSMLRIVGNKGDVVTDLAHFNYTSGLITTKHKYAQTYGYFEVYASVPQNVDNAFWPAFWLLPEVEGEGPQEIDIMEMVMNFPHNVYTTYHCNYSKGGASQGVYTNTDVSQGFHTFALQWLPNILIWYVDGKEVFNISDQKCVPNRPEYILANLAIGGSWPAPPNASTPFPSYYTIDYIRAYQYSSSGGISINGPNSGIDFTPNFDSPAKLDIFDPYVIPQTVSPGQPVKIVVTIVVNSNTPYSNLHVQFPINNITNSLTTLTVSNINIGAGFPSSQIISTTYTIPSDSQTGYIRIGVGISDSNWENIFWEDNVVWVGVNAIIGG